MVDSDIALLFVLLCAARRTWLVRRGDAMLISQSFFQAASCAYRPGPKDDDKRSGVTFIVKAKTGGQGLVFAFVSLAHLYSFCMMLSIHS